MYPREISSYVHQEKCKNDQYRKMGILTATRWMEYHTTEKEWILLVYNMDKSYNTRQKKPNTKSAHRV
jgi:hypothetical protein